MAITIGLVIFLLIRASVGSTTTLIQVVYPRYINCTPPLCNKAMCSLGPQEKSVKSPASCVVNNLKSNDPQMSIFVTVSKMANFSSDQKLLLDIVQCDLLLPNYTYLVLVQLPDSPNHVTRVPSMLKSDLERTPKIIISGAGNWPTNHPHSCAYNEWLNSPQVITVGAFFTCNIPLPLSLCSAILVAQNSSGSCTGGLDITFDAAAEVTLMVAEVKTLRPNLTNIDIQYLLKISADKTVWSPRTGWGHVDRSVLMNKAKNWTYIDLRNKTTCKMVLPKGSNRTITFPHTVHLTVDRPCDIRFIFSVTLKLDTFREPDGENSQYSLNFVVIKLTSSKGTTSQLTGVCAGSPQKYEPPKFVRAAAFMGEQFNQSGWSLHLSNDLGDTCNTNLTRSVVFEAEVVVEGVTEDPLATTTMTPTTTTVTPVTSTTTTTTLTTISTSATEIIPSQPQKTSTAPDQNEWRIAFCITLAILVVLVIVVTFGCINYCCNKVLKDNAVRWKQNKGRRCCQEWGRCTCPFYCIGKLTKPKPTKDGENIYLQKNCCAYCCCLIYIQKPNGTWEKIQNDFNGNEDTALQQRDGNVRNESTEGEPLQGPTNGNRLLLGKFDADAKYAIGTCCGIQVKKFEYGEPQAPTQELGAALVHRKGQTKQKGPGANVEVLGDHVNPDGGTMDAMDDAANMPGEESGV